MGTSDDDNARMAILLLANSLADLVVACSDELRRELGDDGPSKTLANVHRALDIAERIDAPRGKSKVEGENA